jgi:hypothetical protein
LKTIIVATISLFAITALAQGNETYTCGGPFLSAQNAIFRHVNQDGAKELIQYYGMECYVETQVMPAHRSYTEKDFKKGPHNVAGIHPDGGLVDPQ